MTVALLVLGLALASGGIVGQHRSRRLARATGVSGTIVDYEDANGERPGAGQSLRLIGCETLEGGMVWLRHRVEEAPTPTPQG